MIVLPLTYCCIKNPSTSEKVNDSEKEKLQPQTIHGTYPSVIKQSLNFSFFDASFFKRFSISNETFLLCDTLMKLDTILKYQNCCSEDFI